MAGSAKWFKMRCRPAAPSAAELAQVQARRDEERKLEELKRQPFVAEALKHFPNAEITGVRAPVEENGGGDVAQFPQKPTSPTAPARKKEV